MNTLGKLVIMVLLSSCSSTGEHLELSELVAANQSNLARISVGMSKKDVIGLMKNNTAITHDGVVNNPWSVESFLGKDGAQYEVLYYITQKNQPFTPVRKSLATEIVLKNGKVVGWGENALEQYKAP